MISAVGAEAEGGLRAEKACDRRAEVDDQASMRYGSLTSLYFEKKDVSCIATPYFTP